MVVVLAQMHWNRYHYQSQLMSSICSVQVFAQSLLLPVLILVPLLYSCQVSHLYDWVAH